MQAAQHTQLTLLGNYMTAGEIETAVGEAADAIANAITPADSITDDHSSNGYEGNDNDNGNRNRNGNRNGNGNGNTLSLHNVWLGPVVAEELVRLIRTCPEWDSISLQNCSGDARLCYDLYLTCTTHPRLRSLSLRHAFQHAYRPTPVETIQTLVYGIRYNARLETLDLQGLRLDASLANLISRALVRNTTLLRLGLRETFFVATTSAGSSDDNEDQKNGAAQILSFGLRFNRTIESLNLDRCTPLADEDLACLLNAVNSNETVLRELSLQYTPCHEESMKAVALLLQENVIEDLDLSYLERKRKRPKAEESEPEDKGESESEPNDDDEDDDDKKQREDSDEPDGTEPSSENENENESEQESECAPESKPEDESNESNSNADETPPTEESSPESRDPDPQGGGGDGDDDSDRIVNTSLKRLAMVGNGLDDDYLESLMGIFAPKRPGKIPSRLEELSLYGNRFSNHGIKVLLERLPRFPFLRRLYLGFQQPPLPELLLPLALRNSNHPSLGDRTTRFQPGLLAAEFERAVARGPENFRLTEVHVLTETAGDEALQRSLRYHTKLNDAGRRILARCCGDASGGGGSSAGSVPLGIWPLVLDRANRLYPLPPKTKTKTPPPGAVASVETGGSSRADDGDDDDDDDYFHAGDVIYCLLHGPMVFENLD